MTCMKRVSLRLILLFVLILDGCNRPIPSVAVIPRTTSTLLWEPMHLGVVESARGSGFHIYWNAPANEGDAERQISLVASSLHKAYRGIIFAPDETLVSRSVVLQAINDQIPIVIVDDELGAPAGPLLSYVSNDEEAGAKLAATRVAKVLNGRGSIAVIGINPRLESSLTREQDFEHALGIIAPDIHVAIRQWGDTNITHQQQIAQEILDGSAHVDAIIALSATATRGAYYAKIAIEPRPVIVIIGFDQDILAPVQTGDVDAVIIQDTLTIGRVAMQNLEAEMSGRKVTGQTKVVPFLVSRDNIGSEAATQLWSIADHSWSAQ